MTCSNTEDFTFNTDERVVLNRKDSPYPKDMNAGQGPLATSGCASNICKN